MRFLIRTDMPFQHAQSIIDEDGTVRWTDGLTPEEYARERGFPVRVIEEDELLRLVAEREASLVTAPVEESEHDYDRALGCLPPCRWTRVNGIEIFHISERVTGSLVAWHARVGHRYFAFTDSCRLSDEDVAGKVIAAP